MQSSILSFDLVVKVINQVNSNCLEVRDQTYLVIGTLIKNGVDLSGLLFESEGLELVIQQIFPAQNQVSLRYIAWCLYIVCKRYLEPSERQLP